MIQQGNAIIRLHYRIDPDTLDDETWAQLVSEWSYIRRIELENFKTAIKAALASAFGNNEQ